MPKQRILPFFIPMEGCSQKCIYCDQVAISGENHSPDAKDIYEALVSFSPDPEAEIAFYGGSFTCLPRDRQLYFLDTAQEALAKKQLGGIRISTRPDAINEEICAFLKEHGVTTVEIGVQSFDSAVLTASKRGYTADIAEKACHFVKEAGLRLGVQLMTGLPEDDPDKNKEAARRSGELGADLLRVYPTLVLENTQLADLYKQGKYTPQTLEEAVDCCRDMAIIAATYDMTIIRIGINPSPEVEGALIAGPYHAAFGGLVKEAVKKAQISELLVDYDPADAAVLFFPQNELPVIFGHGRAAIRELGFTYPLLALIPDQDLSSDSLRLVLGEKIIVSSLKEFCQRAAAK